MGLARAEPSISLAVALAVGLPMLLVDHVPIDDGPEHVLGSWLDREVDRPGSAAAELYVPSGAPPTYVVIPTLLRIALSIAEPANLLRWLAFLLPVGLLYAVRANLAGADPRQKLLAMLAAASIALDVSFYKGFLSFYAGVIALLLAIATLDRARPATRSAWRWLGLYAALAITCLLSHPLAYALCCAIVGLRLLSAERDRAWWLRVAVCTLPSALVGTWILGLLVNGGEPGAHRLSPTYFYDPTSKVLAFFDEGWATIGRWQRWTAGAAFAWMAALWSTRDSSSARLRIQPPLVPAFLAVLYVALPEEFAGWSWISIRVPLLVGLAAALAIGKSSPPTTPRLVRARGALLIAGCALFIAQVGLTTRTVVRLGDAIDDWVEAGSAIPAGSVVLTFLPPTYPAIGRVNVLHHATAYIAMSHPIVYPEVFARDARQHRNLVRPQLRAEVYGLASELPWVELVSAEHRARWFESHPRTIAIAFEPDPEIARRLASAARETRKINERVTVYFGRESPSS